LGRKTPRISWIPQIQKTWRIIRSNWSDQGAEVEQQRQPESRGGQVTPILRVAFCAIQIFLCRSVKSVALLF